MLLASGPLTSGVLGSGPHTQPLITNTQYLRKLREHRLRVAETELDFYISGSLTSILFSTLLCEPRLAFYIDGAGRDSGKSKERRGGGEERRPIISKREEAERYS